ncbi:right-handed parallel beta-helix repeat-containing protein [Bradyrhizobium cenepequi]
MAALDTTIVKSAYLEEYGRSGIFRWQVGNFSGLAADDPLQGVYVPSATVQPSSGCWVRDFSGPVNVAWFGACGNGLTDDAAAWNAAIQVARVSVYVPTTRPTGELAIYLLGGSIVLNKSVSIVGDDRATTIVLAPGMATPLFDIRASSVAVKNLEIAGSGTQTNILFLLNTGISSLSYITVENVGSSSAFTFMADAAHATNIVTNLYIRNCAHRQPRGRGLLLQDCFAFIFVTKFFVDYVGVTAPTSNCPAIALLNNQGAIFEDCDVLGGTIPGMSSRSGFYIQNSQAVWLKRCDADTLGGFGILCASCQYVYMVSCTASLCDNHGIYSTSSQYVMITNSYAGGRHGIAGSAANIDSIFIESSQRVTVTNCVCVNATRYGYEVGGVAPTAIATGMSFSGNGSGNYALQSGASHLTMSQLASGALITSASAPSAG